MMTGADVHWPRHGLSVAHVSEAEQVLLAPQGLSTPRVHDGGGGGGVQKPMQGPLVEHVVVA